MSLRRSLIFFFFGIFCVCVRVRLYLCMCLCSFVNVCTDWCVLACVCAGSPGCGLITAASRSVLSRPPGAHLPPSTLHLPPLSCSKHPRLTSGRSCFPRCCCFPTTALLKHRIQTWPPGNAGSCFRRTLYDLMKGISAAF